MHSQEFSVIRHRLRLLAAWSLETGDLEEFIRAIPLWESAAKMAATRKLAGAALSFYRAAQELRAQELH
jgi:hypothetical protein